MDYCPLDKDCQIHHEKIVNICQEYKTNHSSLSGQRYFIILIMYYEQKANDLVVIFSFFWLNSQSHRDYFLF